jgi:hypothetical protein
MRRRDGYTAAREAEGVIQRVDPVARELAALVGGSLVNIYVPPDCAVLLRGERVKLRMVQPRDRVRVAYSVADGLTAREVEVLPRRPWVVFFQWVVNSLALPAPAAVLTQT